MWLHVFAIDAGEKYLYFEYACAHLKVMELWKKAAVTIRGKLLVSAITPYGTINPSGVSIPAFLHFTHPTVSFSCPFTILF